VGLSLAASVAHAGPGDELFAAGDYAGALESFGRELAVADLGPQVATTFLKMARCHIELGQTRLAEVRLRRLLRDYPDAPAAAGGVALLEELLRARAAWAEGVQIADGLLSATRASAARVPLLRLRARGLTALGRDEQAAHAWAQLYSSDLSPAERARIRGEVKEWLRGQPLPFLRWVIREFDYAFPSDYALLALIEHYQAQDPGLAKRLADHFLDAFPNHPERAALLAPPPPPPQPAAAPTPWRWPFSSRPAPPAHTYDPRRIDLLAPATGPLAAVGLSLLQGAQLAVERYGEKHAAPESGRVELRLRDAGANEAQAQRVWETVVGDEPLPIAVVGPATSGAARALAPMAAAAGLPLLSPSASAPDLTAAQPYLFRHNLSDTAQVRRLVEYAVTERDARRLAVFYPHNDYGRHFRDLFVAAAECAGAEVVAKASYTPDAVDFGREIRNLLAQDAATNARKVSDVPVRPAPLPAGSPRFPRDASGNLVAGPPLPRELTPVETPPPTAHEEERTSALEAIFIPGPAETVGTILPQLVYYGVERAIWLGTEEWMAEPFIRRGERFTRRAVFTTGFFPVDGEADGLFAADYRRRFGTDPDRLAAQAFEVTHLVLTALDNGVATGPDLHTYLTGGPVVDGLSGPLWVDASGEIESAPRLLTVRHRHFEPLPEGLPPVVAWEPPADPQAAMGPPRHLWELPLAGTASVSSTTAPAIQRRSSDGMVPGLFEEDRWGIPIP
jgi:ABC-type branched-subunit amino acid transport system substrate-binding protein